MGCEKRREGCKGVTGWVGGELAWDIGSFWLSMVS